MIANGSGCVPHTVTEMKRLRAALGPETVAMMQRHEAQGTTDHPTYEAAITILYHRHLCRLDAWPASLQRSLDGINMDVYGTMWGPNEFCCVGTLKDWDRLAEMGRIKVPCLILSGLHDELTPEGAMLMQDVLPNATERGLPQQLAHAVLRGARGLLRGAARLPRSPERVSPPVRVLSGC